MSVGNWLNLNRLNQIVEPNKKEYNIPTYIVYVQSTSKIHTKWEWEFWEKISRNSNFLNYFARFTHLTLNTLPIILHTTIMYVLLKIARQFFFGPNFSSTPNTYLLFGSNFVSTQPSYALHQQYALSIPSKIVHTF